MSWAGVAGMAVRAGTGRSSASRWPYPRARRSGRVARPSPREDGSLRIGTRAREAVHRQGSGLDVLLRRTVVVGRRGHGLGVVDAHDDDRGDPLRFEPAALSIEAEASVIDGSLAVDGRRPLEAVALAHDRVDDVDLDHGVRTFDVGDRLGRV